MADNPTTRRLPRTSGEAFKDAEYATPYQHWPRRRRVRLWVWVALAGALYLLWKAFAP